MPRALDSETLAQIELDHVRPRFFLEIELSTGSTLNYWTGEADISWNGKTWLSNSFFRSFDQVSSSIDAGYEGVTIKLAGEPQALIATMLTSLQRYRELNLFFGFVGSDGAVIYSPVEFSGLIESATLEDGVDEATITIRATSHMALAEKSVDRRFNAQSQAIDYPTDLGFEYVEKLQDFNGAWAKASPPKKSKNDDRKNKTDSKKNKRRRAH